MTIAEIMKKMITFSNGNIHDIDHFLHVWSYAKMIGELEQIDPETQYILEVAAITHDIACPLCREKYGNTNGKHQEEEGIPLVTDFLSDTGMTKEQIERVAYLVGHHHTYTDIDGMDYQILVEADFLVNYFEDHLETESIKKSVKKIFKTETGIRIATEMFFPEEFQMSDTWAQDGLQELDDFIEAQGIYIRQ